jgi:hypothetical protein
VPVWPSSFTPSLNGSTTWEGLLWFYCFCHHRQARHFFSSIACDLADRCLQSTLNVIQQWQNFPTEALSLDFRVCRVRERCIGRGGRSRDTAPPLTGKPTLFPKSQTSQKTKKKSVSSSLLAHFVTSITDLGCPWTTTLHQKLQRATFTLTYRRSWKDSRVLGTRVGPSQESQWPV